MTEKQKQCLDFLKEYIAEHGYSPSYRIIADNLGLVSLGNISRIIEALEARGKIKRIAGMRRSIEIIDGDAFYLIQVIEEIRRKRSCIL